MSKFSDWTREKLGKRFGLRQVSQLEVLESWLAMPVELTDLEVANLTYLRDLLAKRVDFWNEEELKIKFIGTLITFVNFETEYFSAFADRVLSGIVDGEEISGVPDLMVATGYQEVGSPFFCLHEYKKEVDNSSPDPAAQCLAAMLTAQTLNQTGSPIYGVYVVGRNWFFMVLEDKKYAITTGHNATQDDIFDIFKILKASKQIFLQKCQALT
ncbi:hypothetical protein [Thermoflexibacter ruber]|uniref:Uncharacterized protein n=1 Tax=Thermoflexibacter ruber TaxID=1003 RepID=A0A1I2DIM4_9BACT|nr:hypothetical protein [Thermoflexibacter ruber]SFE80465.1 hypothetical protein SAMN04488541_100738 [Thermoflexibacter ruber]